MAHNISLKDCNVVIIANTFNVAIMNSVWLYKNGIFTEEELQGCTSFPVTVQLQTNRFHFNLVPDRLQFTLKPEVTNKKGLIKEKIGTLVNTLPHTPFTAAGLNFTYHITPVGENVQSLSRQLFHNENSALFEGNDIDNGDLKFGGYFSKDWHETRFRLDAKPVNVKEGSENIEKIKFAYNFNINLDQHADNNEKIMTDLFEKWDEAELFTKQLTEKINAKE